MVGLAALVALLTSVVVCWVALLVGSKLGFVDRPDGDLKTHTGSPIPLGGVGVLVSLHVALGVAGQADLLLLAATVLVFAMGLVDDARGLPPVARLIGAAVAGVIVAFGPGPEGLLGSLATIVLVVVAVNAVNLFDGLDGLAGAVTLLGAAGLAILASGAGGFPATVVLAAGLLGFLFFNWAPARMYLGDNGAYVVGVTLAWGAGQISMAWAEWLVAAALIGVPLLDMIITITRRVAARRPLFAGDRDHTYDLVSRRTGSVVKTVLMFAGAQIVWCAALLLTNQLWGPPASVSVAAALGVVAVAYGWSGGRAGQLARSS